MNWKPPFRVFIALILFVALFFQFSSAIVSYSNCSNCHSCEHSEEGKLPLQQDQHTCHCVCHGMVLSISEVASVSLVSPISQVNDFSIMDESAIEGPVLSIDYPPQLS